jgi:hypothetical protein
MVIPRPCAIAAVELHSPSDKRHRMNSFFMRNFFQPLQPFSWYAGSDLYENQG